MSELITHNWYQTEEKVVVSVMIKNAQELNCKVTIEQDSLVLEADNFCKLELHLCEPINVEKSFYKFGSVKVEVTLIKLVSRHWTALTKDEAERKRATVEDEEFVEIFCRKLFASADFTNRRIFDCSSNGTVLSVNWKEIAAMTKEKAEPKRKAVNNEWDGIAKSVEEEKTEDDEAMNEIKPFYSSGGSASGGSASGCGSFSESNGTVLSTNWKEIFSKKN